MSLQNLVGISLETVEPHAQQVRSLLAAADRNIADAHIAGLSEENQFDTTYKAIMQLAMLGLMAHGYRTLTSKPATTRPPSRRWHLPCSGPVRRSGRWTPCASSAI
ncbi:hypothetical protein [Comamonas sp. MYb396]|uniref:hypothetical protein n=1 Tax=Comamonas sp. MYb396 TaxID=2745302 RepID=UPI00309826AC